MQSRAQNSRISRRRFVKSGAAGSAALAAAIASRSCGAAEETVKIALVGCGSRGTAAVANVFSTGGPTKLYVMADLFSERIEFSRNYLAERFPNQVDVAPDRRFVGFDGFRKAMDAMGKGDVVILTAPPVFRPPHFDYAVKKDLHVFMEKSFAVDAPGIRRMLAAAESSQREDLKVVGGLMWRHDRPREAFVAKMREVPIGQVMLMRRGIIPFLLRG